MKYRIILTMCIAAFHFTSKGQSNNPFPNLTKVVVEMSLDSDEIIFGYDTKTTRLLNQGASSLPKNDYWYKDPEDFGEEMTKVALYANDRIKDTLEIIYSPGLSADPEFMVFKRKNHKELGRIYATSFYINSAGAVYSSGHTNNMFNTRRKFQITQDTIVEIKQPFYYVGLKSRTTSQIALYQNKTGGAIISYVPKNAEVEVLFGDEEDHSKQYYLIKTDFGLVGWFRLDGYESPIKGLYYAGD